MAFQSASPRHDPFQDAEWAFERAEDELGERAVRVEKALTAVEEALITPKLKLGEHERETFQDKLTFVLMLMFGIPCLSCVLLSTHPSVKYWLGPAGKQTALFCLIWIFIGHHVLRTQHRRLIVIQLLLFPAIALILVSHYMKLIAFDTHTQLGLNDCVAFEQKHVIERAWQDANTLLANCIDNQISITGSPREEVESVTQVHHCPGYEQGMETWKNEWNYLQELEERESCSGWCTLERPLWHPQLGGVVDGRERCSYVVAGVMKYIVYRTTLQITLYCVVLVLVLGIMVGMIEL